MVIEVRGRITEIATKQYGTTLSMFHGIAVLGHSTACTFILVIPEKRKIESAPSLTLARRAVQVHPIARAARCYANARISIVVTQPAQPREVVSETQPHLTSNQVVKIVGLPEFLIFTWIDDHSRIHGSV